MYILECMGCLSSGFLANVVMGFLVCYLLVQSVLRGDLENFKNYATFVTISPESCSLVSERMRLVWKGLENVHMKNDYLEIGKTKFLQRYIQIYLTKILSKYLEF